MNDAPMTVVETPAFIHAAKSLVQDGERMEIIAWLAENPETGVIMRETGGVRKARWAGNGQGKSGGYRIIYYFHSMRMPLFMLYMYGKNDKANLTRAERNAMRKLTAILAAYGGKENE